MNAVPPGGAAAVARRFSPLPAYPRWRSRPSAFCTGLALIGSPTALVGTPYGQLALAKGMLFAGMLALTAANRFRLVPALSSPGELTAARRLRSTVAAGIVLGIGAVGAAGLLTGMPPAIHALP